MNERNVKVHKPPQTAWCINCFRPFDRDGVRCYFGARYVGPFCEACDEVIKAHTRFHAASDMLMALKLIIHTHDAVCRGEACNIGGIDLARAAIARAEGKA